MAGALVAIGGGRTLDARGQQFVFELRADARLRKILFDVGDWNRIERVALTTAGRDWIERHLPERFTRKAIDRLGYHAAKLDRDTDQAQGNRRLNQAIRSGLMDELAKTWTRGWNPWTYPFPPDAELKRYIAYMQRTEHRFLKTRTGEWKTARKELRALTKRILLGKLAERPDAPTGTLLPLVDKGTLRKEAETGSRADAVATRNRASLKIVIPQPHGTHPIVSQVLRQVTQDELVEMGNRYGEVFSEMLAGSETYTRKRGPSAGAVLGRLTADQRAAANQFTKGRQDRAIDPTRSAAAKAAHAARRQRAVPGGVQRSIPA